MEGDWISVLEYFKDCHMEKDLDMFYLGLGVKLGQCMDDTVRQIVDQYKGECSKCQPFKERNRGL